VDVHVLGEIASYRPWRSGHWYFDLKDAESTISCAMFSADNRRVAFTPEDGMQIVVRGRVSAHASPVTRLQLVVTHMDVVGAGALAVAFEQLKRRLAAEGLFDPARKKPLPALPMRVGVVTSPQGAALRDVVKVLRARLPNVSIVVAPTRVQGEGSAAEIASAITRLDVLGCDVMLVVRGGGSFEDLQAFNDERVARAIHTARTPIVSGVGHETDTTIADFVADLRAATPSQAAELAVPRQSDLLRRLDDARTRLTQQMRRRIDRARLELQRVEQRIGDPRVLLLQAQQRTDDLDARLQSALMTSSRLRRAQLDGLAQRLSCVRPEAQLKAQRAHLSDLATRLVHASPRPQLVQQRAHLHALDDKLRAGVLAQRTAAGRQLAVAVGRLHALSPLAVLERGYALALRVDDGALVRSVTQVVVGADLDVKLHDGRVRARVVSVGDDDSDKPR
jgi:exodeoxyribonuclease VII large subunit